MKTTNTKAAKKAATETSPKETADKDLLLSFWHHINEHTTSKAITYSQAQQEDFINDFITRQTAPQT